jgi:hypothetical protein
MRYFLLAILFVVVITGCQKELTGTDIPGSNAVTCKSCEYNPLCEGSYYTFIDTIQGGVVSERTDTIRIIKDSLIGGDKYQELKDNTGTGQRTFFSCKSGVTTSIALNTSIANPAIPGGGINIPSIKLTLLKSNEGVGASWKDTVKYDFDPGIGFPISVLTVYTHTIISKGGTRVVLGKTFNDVIRVKQEIELQIPGFPLPLPPGSTLPVSDYYYSKGIGLIEYEQTADIPGAGATLINHRVLKDYLIK